MLIECPRGAPQHESHCGEGSRIVFRSSPHYRKGGVRTHFPCFSIETCKIDNKICEISYYALILLNQVIITAKEESVSLKLTEIYFTIFRRYMEDTSSLVQTRILTAILTGN